jgi:hypothetical protein
MGFVTLPAVARGHGFGVRRMALETFRFLAMGVMTRGAEEFCVFALVVV